MADTDKLGSPFDPTQPDRNADPRLGDNQIADTKQRLHNWATVEHNVDGKHKIPTSTGLPMPDATAIGRLAIRSDTKELYADITGTAFEKLTSKSEITALQGADTTHAASNPIDHVDGSITGAKIASLAITGAKIAASTITQDKMAFSLDATLFTTSVSLDATQSWSPGVAVSALMFEIWGAGAGGASGGGDGSGDSNDAPSGGGGGSGAYTRHIVYFVPAINPTIAVTVGEGGLGGIGNSGYGNPGVDGSLSSVGYGNSFAIVARGGIKGTSPTGWKARGLGGLGGTLEYGGSSQYWPPTDVPRGGNAGADGVDSGTGDGGLGGEGIYGIDKPRYGKGGKGGKGNGGGGGSQGVSGESGENGRVIIRYKA